MKSRTAKRMFGNRFENLEKSVEPKLTGIKYQQVGQKKQKRHAEVLRLKDPTYGSW